MLTPPNARRERIPVPPRYDKTPNDEGLLTWEWVEEQVAKSNVYWVCSVRPDSRPHARPLWGVYLDHALYFDGFFRSIWFSNLKANPFVTVHLESGTDAVMIEGRAEVTESMKLAQRIADAYAAKYPPYTPEPETGGYVLRPHKVYAWRGGTPAESGTRWVFEGG